MIIYLVTGIPLLLMAIVTILLLKDWRKWKPIFGKIAEFASILYGLALGSVLLYFFSKYILENFSNFINEYGIRILYIINIPLTVVFVIVNYLGLFVLFNNYAQPATNPEEENSRSSAVGCAMLIGGTLNLALVGLFLQYGPFGSTYDMIDKYSRSSGLDDGLTVTFTAAMSCWSIIPLIYKRIRHSK